MLLPPSDEAARLLCDQSHVLKNKILDTFHPGCPFMPHDLGKGRRTTVPQWWGLGVLSKIGNLPKPNGRFQGHWQEVKT